MVALFSSVSENAAEWLYWGGQLLLVVAAVAGAVGAFAMIVGDRVRDRFSDQRMSDNELKTADANRRAAEADQRAAEANKAAESERLARVQLETKISSRSIPHDKIPAFAAILRPFAPQTLDIIVCDNSAESGMFARQIDMAIERAGWKVRIWNAPGRVVGGVNIKLINNSPSPNEPIKALISALQSVGIDAPIAGFFTSRDREENPFELPPGDAEPPWNDATCAPVRIIVGAKMDMLDVDNHNAMWIEHFAAKRRAETMPSTEP